jgi:dihydrodipicolinate synthase/N-acetylneuraminate lyase
VGWAFRSHETSGDLAAAQKELDALGEVIQQYPPHAALKHLLHVIAGLPRCYVRPPLRELTAAERADLDRAIEALPVG